MRIHGDVLFLRRNMPALAQALDYRRNQLRAKVDKLPEKLFRDKSDEEIAADIAKSEAIVPLQIDLDNAIADVTETQMEVRDDYGFRPGTFRVAALEATKRVPFTGDPKLWELHPSQYDTNPPRGEIRGSFLTVGMAVRPQQGEQAKQHIDATLASVLKYVTAQRGQIEAYNARISGEVLPLLYERRARLDQATALRGKL